MLRKSLELARAKAGENQVAASQRSTEAQTVLETLQADVQSTTGVEEAARAELKEKVAAVELAQSTVKSEEELCEEAKAAKALVTVEHQKIEEAKAELESINNGSLRMLLDGGWEEEEVRDACIDGVCSYMGGEDADAVLLAALPNALRCRPAECGAFDKIVVDEVSRFFSQKIAACEAQLAQGQESVDDAIAEHTGAWAILEMAREKVEATIEVRDSADAALGRATVDKKLAQSKAMDQDETLATMLAEAALAEGKVRTLNVALSSLAELEAGEPPVNADKENAMAVDEEVKSAAIAFDHLPVAMTA